VAVHRALPDLLAELVGRHRPRWDCDNTEGGDSSLGVRFGCDLGTAISVLGYGLGTAISVPGAFFFRARRLSSRATRIARFKQKRYAPKARQRLLRPPAYTGPAKSWPFTKHLDSGALRLPGLPGKKGSNRK
jgi:hypothetical protein